MDSPHRPVIVDEWPPRSLWLKNRNRGHRVHVVMCSLEGSEHRELREYCRCCGNRLISTSMEEVGHASASCRYSEV